MESKYIKSIVIGAVGMILLAGIYWLILFLVSGDLNHPWAQFMLFKYWMSALILGFGIQVGLYWFVRSGLHLYGSVTKTAVAAGATTSTVSMAACCAHHIFDILPLLGFSAFALFLSEYQTHFFALGVISNTVGIIIMIRIIQHKKMPKIFNELNLKKWKLKRK